MAATIDGTTGLTAPSGAIFNGIASGTAVASTSGTSIDFTSIPAWVKRITVMFQGVSNAGASSNLLIQLGTSSGVTTSGYLGSSSLIAATVATSTYTTGFGSRSGDANAVIHGGFVINLISGNTWMAFGVLGTSNAATTVTSGGSVALAATLDRVRITSVNGTDTFDAGSINILYE